MSRNAKINDPLKRQSELVGSRRSGPEGRQEIARSVTAGLPTELRIIMPRSEGPAQMNRESSFRMCRPSGPSENPLTSKIPRPDGRGYYLPALRASCWASSLFMAFGVFTCTAKAASRETVEGFSEPYRTIHIASAEIGLLQSLLVNVGDQVVAGQRLATLDDDLQRAQLAIAQQQVDATGRLKAAEAERAINQRRVEKLLQLVGRGQASVEETDRAKANLEIAEGKLLAEQDEQKLLVLQLERARLAVLKRSLLAPASGVVSEVHRQLGEFVSPAAPQVVTLVELDPLAATFLVNRSQLLRLKNQQSVRVQFADAAQQVQGQVDSIAPVTDAESGTTAVRIRIANPAGQFRGGERCLLELP
jgi:RND family efflux transporter MFP subunit